MLWEWAFEEGPVPFCLVWRLPKLLGNSKGLDENRMNSNTIKAHCSPEGLASFVLNTCFLSCYKLLVNFHNSRKCWFWQLLSVVLLFLWINVLWEVLSPSLTNFAYQIIWAKSETWALHQTPWYRLGKIKITAKNKRKVKY